MHNMHNPYRKQKET